MAHSFDMKKEEERFKKLARDYVARAIKLGEIIKPKRCSNCPRRKNIQAHHENYYKPLDIIWLCPRCHRFFDKARRKREQARHNPL